METIRKIVIEMPPITKKNHQRIVMQKKGDKKVPMIIPSKEYCEYERYCIQHYITKEPVIAEPVNVRAIYYMPTKRRVDLINLHEALHDVLVKCNVLHDDDSTIIVATDGSRVEYDKFYPRTEVYIERYEDDRND